MISAFNAFYNSADYYQKKAGGTKKLVACLYYEDIQGNKTINDSLVSNSAGQKYAIKLAYYLVNPNGTALSDY